MKTLQASLCLGQALLCLGAAALLSAPVLSAQEPAADAVPRPMPPASTEKIDYDTHIKPIMEKSCLECHNATKKKSKLRLDTRDLILQGGVEGPSVIVGDSANSNLIKILLGTLPDYETMPPAEDFAPLTDEEIGLLRAWIDQGLLWGAETAPANPAEAAVPGLPEDWKAQATNQAGPLATWGLIQDSKGPNGEQLIGVTAVPEPNKETLNLLWTPKAEFKDGGISLNIKATGGAFSAGVAARIKDSKNYYAAILDWTKMSLRIDLVQDGKFSTLSEHIIEEQFPEWVPLKVTFNDKSIIAESGTTMRVMVDNTVHSDTGGLGYVTVGDSTAAFTAFKKD